MKKIQAWFDTLSQYNPHTYTIVMGLIVTAIGGMIVWLVSLFIGNSIVIINGLLGFSTYTMDIIYQSISRGDGKFQFLMMSSSIIFGIGMSMILIPFIVRHLKNKSPNLDKNIREKRSYRIFEIIFLVYFMLVMIISLYKYNVTVFFDQSLNIITPYISEQEVKIIKSKFSQMNSRHDFSEIVLTIKNTADKNNLTLPKVYTSFILPI